MRGGRVPGLADLGVQAEVTDQLAPVREALDGADALAVVTEWLVYRNPDFQRIRTALREPVLIDGRNLYAPDRMRELGFRHATIGRGGL